MNILYTEQEISDLTARINRRRIITYILSVPFFALFVYFFAMHLRVTVTDPGPIPDNTLKILAAIAAILGSFVLIFGLTFCVKPLKSYRAHITNSLHGRCHDVTYRFKAVEPDLSVIDHITFRSVVFDGEPDRHGITEHMFYWDNLKELPDFVPGEDVNIRYYDRFICGWSREIGHAAAGNVE